MDYTEEEKSRKIEKIATNIQKLIDVKKGENKISLSYLIKNLFHLHYSIMSLHFRKLIDVAKAEPYDTKEMIEEVTNYFYEQIDLLKKKLGVTMENMIAYYVDEDVDFIVNQYKALKSRDAKNSDEYDEIISILKKAKMLD